MSIICSSLGTKCVYPPMFVIEAEIESDLWRKLATGALRQQMSDVAHLNGT